MAGNGDKDMTEQTLLTRENAIPQYTDPTGKVWTMAKANDDHALYTTAIVQNNRPFRPQFALPDYVSGNFTSKEKGYRAISRFLNALWDKAEEQARRNVRTSKATT